MASCSNGVLEFVLDRYTRLTVDAGRWNAVFLEPAKMRKLTVAGHFEYAHGRGRLMAAWSGSLSFSDLD